MVSKISLVLYVYFVSGVVLPSPEQNKVEQYLHAIITVESNWSVRAISYTGDIGLAQINPRGALQEYNNYHKNKITIPDLYNPVINLQVGSWYFKHMLKTFSGDFDKAVAAYNMGPNKIRNGMKNAKYVQKVKGHLSKDATQ